MDPGGVITKLLKVKLEPSIRPLSEVFVVTKHPGCLYKAEIWYKYVCFTYELNSFQFWVLLNVNYCAFPKEVSQYALECRYTVGTGKECKLKCKNMIHTDLVLNRFEIKVCTS